MKKIFLALAAVAALAACSKSEVEYEATGEITFTPIAKNITKAMMEETAFNTEEQFSVWAFYNPTVTPNKDIDGWVAEYNANLSDAVNPAKVYIDNKPFEYHATNNLWGGATPYFWPKVGTLAFAGYHPTTANASYTLSGDANQMVFTDVKRAWVTAEENNAEDLMYFNLTQCYNGNNVTAVFKHALSWLTVNLATDQTTLDAGATITVSSVKFTDVKPQGDGVVANQAAIAWTAEGTPAAVEVLAGNVTLAVTPQEQKEPLFIPQDMAGNLEITYTISSTDGSAFTETKVIKLNTMASGETTLSKWEAAKHYIYNIVITTEEILIDPKVVEWTDVEIPVEVK